MHICTCQLSALQLHIRSINYLMDHKKMQQTADNQQNRRHLNLSQNSRRTAKFKMPALNEVENG